LYVLKVGRTRWADCEWIAIGAAAIAIFSAAFVALAASGDILNLPTLGGITAPAHQIDI
jgi:hypothetical protein